MKNEKLGYCDNCFDFVEYRTEKIRKEFEVRGIKVEAEVYVAFCCECGEEVSVYSIDKANEIRIFDAYKKAKGLLTSEEMIKLRQKRGLSQKAMAKLLGMGEKDICRYENGAIQTQAQDKKIRDLIDDYQFLKNANNNGNIVRVFINQLNGYSHSFLKNGINYADEYSEEKNYEKGIRTNSCVKLA